MVTDDQIRLLTGSK